MGTTNYTSLTYLEEMTGSDTSFKRELIEMFLLQMDEFSGELWAFHAAEQWKELGELAHKAKSSVLVFGMEELGNKLKELQLKTQQQQQQQQDVASYEQYLRIYDAHCQGAKEELQNYLIDLKS